MDHQRANQFGGGIEHRHRNAGRSVDTFAYGDGVPVYGGLLDEAAQLFPVSDRSVGHLRQIRAQHLLSQVGRPSKQDPTRRADRDRRDLADGHLAPQCVSCLGNRDTHAVLTLRAEKARRLACGVSKVFEHRVDHGQDIEVLARRRTPVGHLHAKPNPVVGSIEKPVRHEIHDQSLYRRLRQASRLLDLP